MTLETNIARTFAALSTTNEAILYAKSPEELYRQVCQAAFSSGDFLATAIFLLEPGTNMLRFAAGFGEDIARLRRIDISILADTPEGSGVCGQAFRDRKVVVSNDFLNDHALAGLAGGRMQGACRRGGGIAADPQRQLRRRAARYAARGRLGERPDRLAASAHVGEHLLCARQFRSRGRAESRRAGDAAIESHVRRHQRDQ